MDRIIRVYYVCPGHSRSHNTPFLAKLAQYSPAAILANMYDHTRIITLEPSLFDEIVDIVYIYRITTARHGSNY